MLLWVQCELWVIFTFPDTLRTRAKNTDIFSAYLLSKCIFLHVHFVYRTLCGMNVSRQNLVCTGSRGTSAPESRQAFARCSSITIGRWGKAQFTLTGVYTNQGKLWVQVHVPELKPILNFWTGTSKPGTEIQENDNSSWGSSVP